MQITAFRRVVRVLGWSLVVAGLGILAGVSTAGSRAALGEVDVRLAADAGRGTVPGTFGVSGSVDGLYPGGSRMLELVVTNPNAFPIVLSDVSTSVEGAGPNCPAGSIAVGSMNSRVLVPAASSTRTNLPVKMSRSATDDCQGATFPLTFTATATEAAAAPRGPNGSGSPKGAVDGSDPTRVLGAQEGNDAALPKTGSPTAPLTVTGVGLLAAGLAMSRWARVHRRAGRRVRATS